MRYLFEWCVISLPAPCPGSSEVVAGENVKLLIGMSNNGDEDFVVTLVEGSFRYPQDFNFHIQNVSSPPPPAVATLGAPRGLHH